MSVALLTQQKCRPCEGIGDRLNPEDADAMMSQVSGWTLSDDRLKISRDFKFKDFKAAMTFINKVAELAESEGHHPDIYCYYNKVKLDLTTHAVKGLSNNDFIMAAKLNEISNDAA